MKRAISWQEAERMLRHRRDIERTDRGIRAAVERGELVRVRRGWFVEAEEWNELWSEGKHLVEVIAASFEMVGGSYVASHVSAAVLHGLPLHRVAPQSVHLTGASPSRASRTADVTRHVDRLHPRDVVEIAGISCTSLERTAFDLMRVLPPEAAVAAADAALRSIAVVDRIQDEQIVARWRDGMRSREGEAGQVRGIRQARWVTEFADGLAELPGESVTRLQLVRLGFPRPRLQVPVDGPDGTTYWVDLGLGEDGALVEFDGKGKYLDEAKRSGRTLEEVLLREKQREDWIRGVTQRRLVRCGDEHIRTPQALRRRLLSFGVHPPR